jgi:hypothetical protein
MAYLLLRELGCEYIKSAGIESKAVTGNAASGAAVHRIPESR